LQPAGQHGKPSTGAAGAFALSPPPLGKQQQSKEGEELSRHERDKKSIYKHPLFPLLALLFEKGCLLML
jgi:hypothetical protein